MLCDLPAVAYAESKAASSLPWPLIHDLTVAEAGFRVVDPFLLGTVAGDRSVLVVEPVARCRVPSERGSRWVRAGMGSAGQRRDRRGVSCWRSGIG